MNKLLHIKLLLLFSLIASCAGGLDDAELKLPGYNGPDDAFTIASTEQSVKTSNKEPVEPESGKATSVDKKIIKTADLTIEVKDFEEARASLGKLLKKHKAYVSNERQNNYDYEISSNLVIRISAQDFDSLLNDVGNLAHKIVSKEVRLSDVTEEFIDISTRLKNKKEVEKQYLELLKRARTIEEILKVNEHLRILREEIESKEGRLKYLESQVSYSTINLYLFERSAQVYSSFGEKLLNGLEGGWKGILAFLIGLTYVWPIIAILGLVLWFLIKRRRKKKQITSK